MVAVKVFWAHAKPRRMRRKAKARQKACAKDEGFVGGFVDVD